MRDAMYFENVCVKSVMCKAEQTLKSLEAITVHTCMCA